MLLRVLTAARDSAGPGQTIRHRSDADAALSRGKAKETKTISRSFFANGAGPSGAILATFAQLDAKLAPASAERHRSFVINCLTRSMGKLKRFAAHHSKPAGARRTALIERSNGARAASGIVAADCIFVIPSRASGNVAFDCGVLIARRWAQLFDPV